MKTKTKVRVAVGVLVVAALALPVANLIAKKPSGTALAVLFANARTDARHAEVQHILESKCAYCHVTGTPRPFYASLPLASGIIERDVQAGLRYFDLVSALSPAPSEPALARLERSIEEGDMPPGKFLALHWNGGLAPSERAALLDWVHATRAANAAPGIPEALRTGVVRPLPKTVAVDARKAALGELLYNDKRLSGDGTLACATCHDLGKGGTDHARVSTGIRGQQGGINAPTTLNAGLQFMQFWDGRAATLADQAGGPPQNPIEMGATWDGIVATLSKDKKLAADMKAIYPDGITKANVTDAIAEFERTLVTPNSKFDRFLEGDASAMSAEEQHGYRVFIERGCATCHVGELLGGKSFEKMGRQADYFATRGNPTDADLGRFNHTHAEGDRYLLKVPTLRNVALTAPYFHDGTQSTLPEAILAMGHYQLGVELAPAEVDALRKFLEALTGELHGKAL